jgi:hypothetical protein
MSPTVFHDHYRRIVLNGSRGFERLQPEPPRLRDEPDGRVSDTVERPLGRVKLAAGAVGACVGVDLPHPVGVPFGRRWLGPACRGEPKRGPTPPRRPRTVPQRRGVVRLERWPGPPASAPILLGHPLSHVSCRSDQNGHSADLPLAYRVVGFAEPKSTKVSLSAVTVIPQM